MLQYDDSAFYFFALSSIIFYIVPCKYAKTSFVFISDAGWFSLCAGGLIFLDRLSFDLNLSCFFHEHPAVGVIPY